MSSKHAEVSRIGGDEGDVFGLSGLIAEFKADATKRREVFDSEGRLTLGPVTPFPALNAMMGGSLPIGLHYVHGGPGVGKTAFALQVAAGCKSSALYVSCEMSCVELMRRMAARVGRVERRCFMTGELTAEAAMKLAAKAVESAPLLKIMDATREPVSIARIQRQAELVRGATDLPHFLLLIDSFHSWAGTDEPDELGALSGKLMQLAKSLECPIVALAERSKDGRDDHSEFGVAGTRGAAYDSESVLALDRVNKDASAEPNGDVEVVLRIPKNRHGEGNKVPLVFNGRYQYFRQVDQKIVNGEAVPDQAAKGLQRG